jgi:YD repeat-containing protein
VVAAKPTSVMVAVGNDGSLATAKPFKVELYDGQTLLAEQTYSGGIAAGDMVEVGFPDAWTPAAGNHPLRVVLDRPNSVAEASESNNTWQQALKVDDNAAPIADLGTTQFTVKAGEGLFLDAYRSYDPDGHIIRYDWFVSGRLQGDAHGRRFRYEAPARAGKVTLTLVVADNTNMPDTQPYLDYVRDPANGYVSVNFLARDTDSMEISCRV